MRVLFLVLLLAAESLRAAEPPPEEIAAKTKEPLPKPTLENVAYGTHAQQVLDFYRAESTEPTPVVMFLHGGGWLRGDKAGIGSIVKVLKAGISIVSIDYRFVQQAQLAGVKTPVEWPMHDAARALQFIRSKAAEWRIDKERIAASGGSAGACTSLWLAFHPDLADPQSADPVARESTRLWCAAVLVPQTSLDPRQIREWIPNATYGGHAFGFMDATDIRTAQKHFDEFLAARDELLPQIREYSPYDLATTDDPPVYLIYPTPPSSGRTQNDATHSANFGVKLAEKLRALGVPCELVYPGAPDVRHPSMTDYLVDRLKARK